LFSHLAPLSHATLLIITSYSQLFLTAPAKVKVQTSWFHLSGFVYSTIMWAVADHLSEVEPSCMEQISLEWF